MKRKPHLRILHTRPWYVRIWRALLRLLRPLLRRTTCRWEWHTWDPIWSGRICWTCGTFEVPVDYSHASGGSSTFTVGHASRQGEGGAMTIDMTKSGRTMMLLYRVSECGSIERERISGELTDELLEQGLLQLKKVDGRETNEVELSKWGRQVVILSIPG